MTVNVWDIALGIAIIALLAFAVWLMVRSRSKGACATCPHSKACNELQSESQDCPATQ